jgi:hypothetical protein
MNILMILLCVHAVEIFIWMGWKMQTELQLEKVAR